MQLTEANLLHKLERCLKIGISLTGKAHHDVGSHPDIVGEECAQFLNEMCELRGGIAATHALQDVIRTGLHGEMEVRHALRQRSHPFGEDIGKIHRFDGTEPDARDAFNLVNPF